MVLESIAHVVVGGQRSEALTLVDMLFQGTVWGPNLWNAFFNDACVAIQELLFSEIVYADDLNAFREFASTVDNSEIQANMDKCQVELHAWGKANQVQFDAGKESKHVLSLSEPEGENFKILGVVFDCQLDMSSAIDDMVAAASWKLRTLIRTQRYYTTAQLILLYKSHLLSFLEYRTAAIYHARRTTLNRLDRVQNQFLRDVGITPEEALFEFNLGPLCMRRDIAMLGLLHRAAIADGPPHFQHMFKRKAGSFRLQDPFDACSRPPIMRRSAWSLIPVYNRLGSGALSIRTTKDFQFYLQERVKKLLTGGHIERWPNTYSPS